MFDEQTDRKNINKGSKSIPEEEIESDNERELGQDDEEAEKKWSLFILEFFRNQFK